MPTIYVNKTISPKHYTRIKAHWTANKAGYTWCELKAKIHYDIVSIGNVDLTIGLDITNKMLKELGVTYN